MRKLIIFTLFTFSLHAQDANTIFQLAGKAYEKENYTLAIKYYRDIEEQELLSSDLYYNMGNCYYKLSKNAQAVLYYEKSLKIDPSSEDAQFNLSLVQLKLVDKFPKVPLIFYEEWTRSFTKILSIDNWAKMALIFLFLFCVYISFLFFGSSVRLKKIMFILSSSTILLGCTCLIAAYLSYSNIETNAILMSPNAYIKSAPSPQSEDLFILHEGTKVLVLEKFSGWTKIKLSDGMIGWIELEHLKEI
jgi:tetratricopeptide (TPR) repeat protein